MIICEGVREMLEGSLWGQHIPAKLNYFDNAKEAALLSYHKHKRNLPVNRQHIHKNECKLLNNKALCIIIRYCQTPTPPRRSF